MIEGCMSVTLVIDGKKITVRRGTTVLEAAKKAGIPIPTLCHDDRLPPGGNCRLCAVEIDGMKGYPTACTTFAENGMTVRTQSDSLLQLRRSVLELTLSEHPYTCLFCGDRRICTDSMGTIRKAGVTTGCESCPKNGACELQILVDSLGLKEMSTPVHYRHLPVEEEDPFFARDYNLCVLCGRCVRVCNEVRFNGTLSLVSRGGCTLVGTAFGWSHLETGCEFCGACVDVCPTGALDDFRTRWEPRGERSARSLCPFCSVGCPISCEGSGYLVRTAAFNGPSLSDRQVCMLGRFALVDLVRDPERLTKPMVKRDGHWAESSWDEAVATIGERFTGVRGDAFALVASPQESNEDLYALQKFARAVMGSNQVFCPSDAVPEGAARALAARREEGLPASMMADIGKARTIVVWGADLSVSHPIAGLKVRRRVEEGARLVVLDPRKTRLASRADLHVPVRPGSDPVFMAGLIRALNERGVPGFRDGSSRFSASEFEKKTGVPFPEAETMAELIAGHRPVCFIFGSGLASYAGGEGIVSLDAISLALAGKTALGCLGESNTMGALEAGCRSGLLPGMIRIDGPGRLRFEKVWKCSLQGMKAVPFAGLARNLETGKVRALYLSGEIPERLLGRAGFVVFQGTAAGPAIREKADVLLPATHLCEQEGSLFNFEGRLQTFRAAVRPEGLARPDWWIVAQIASRMGSGGFRYRKSGDVFAEMAGFIPSCKKGSGVRKPSQKPSVSPGAKPYGIARAPATRLETGTEAEGAVLHEKGKAKSRSIRTGEDFPFILILGSHSHRLRQVPVAERVPGAEAVIPPGRIDIHPADAKALHLRDGRQVALISKTGTRIPGFLRLTKTCPSGILYALFPFRGLAPEELPENRAAVRIERM